METEWYLDEVSIPCMHCVGAGGHFTPPSTASGATWVGCTSCGGTGVGYRIQRWLERFKPATVSVRFDGTTTDVD